MYKKEKLKLELKEEFLFCESLQTTAAVTDVMNFIKDFFGKHYILVEKIGYVSIDSAPAMLGCKLGFVAQQKRPIQT